MKKIAVLWCCLFSLHSNAQVDINQLVSYADSMMNQGISEPMISGAVMGIANSESILLLQGYGYGDYNKKVNVDSESTLFQVGSVGKVITSVALLQQVDAGKVGLQDDVNDYLEGWALDNPYDNVVTPFHLLTHSAGLNDQFIGYMAESNADIVQLGEHLSSNMPGLFKPPGTEINYSNYSYALAGHMVERVTGNDFKEQVSEKIFDPLGMETASYYVPDDYLDNDQYANGYLWRDTFEQVKMYPRHAIPAGSLVASGKDMITFAQALLKRDSLLLPQEAYQLLLNQQYSNHPELTGYTLGMEVQNINGHIAYAKAGQVTGFLSLLIIFPELELSIFIASNTETDNFLEDFFKGLKEQFFPVREISTEVAPFYTKEYIGNYANERCNHDNIEELFALFAGHFQIYESDLGLITAYHNGQWNDYQHKGNDVFYNTENPNSKMVFKRDQGGKITSLYRSVNVAGIQIPASYRKLSWVERPRFINDEYPVLLLILLTYLLMPIAWIGKLLVSFKIKKPLYSRKIPKYYDFAALAFVGLFLWNIVGFFIPLLQLREKIALGLPENLMNFSSFNWAMALCALILLLLSVKLWVFKAGSLWFRIYYTLFSLVACSYILILNHWQLLTIEV
ncbi:MAG: beta-lactamase family protein [Saprospiraceae bacterium]|nr:beta-lactamase family protein [Saprospiraceae bacterium]